MTSDARTFEAAQRGRYDRYWANRAAGRDSDRGFRYYKGHSTPCTPLVESLLEHVPRPAAVLDVGAGAGRNSVFLAARGYSAWGLDVSPVALASDEWTAAREQNLPATPVLGSALGMPFAENSFDAGIDDAFLHHLPMALWTSYASELRRVIRPAGWLVLAGFSAATVRWKGYRYGDSHREIRESDSHSTRFLTRWDLVKFARCIGHLETAHEFAQTSEVVWWLATFRLGSSSCL